jgi:hypothetical protein
VNEDGDLCVLKGKRYKIDGDDFAKLRRALKRYLARMGRDVGNGGVEGWSFYGQMERDGKVYQSVCSVGGDIAGMPSGKEVVLVLAPEDPRKKKNW